MSSVISAAAFDRLPGPVRAAIWTVLSALCMVGFSSIAEHLADDLPVPGIIFSRGLFGILFLIPWMLRVGRAGFRTQRPLLVTARRFNNLTGLFLVFSALSLMPVADVIAIMFTKPMFASVAAMLILGEVMYGRRWCAVAVGFVGVLVIVRPGFTEMNLGVLFALGAMISGAFTTISVKLLTRTDAPDTIVVWALIIILVGSSVPAALYWQTPAGVEFLWLALLGGLATGFQRCLARALAAADATIVLPFEFSRLPLAAAGWLFFGQVADAWTWAGALVIFTASLALVHREAGRV